MIFNMSSVMVLMLVVLHLCDGKPRSQSASVRCGVPQMRENKAIMHAYESIPGAWPWHTAVYHREGINYKYVCGGTLVSQNFILTAAHCVMNPGNGHLLSKKNVFVRLGVYSLHVLNCDTLQQHLIQEIYKHDSYRSKSVQNDIAILELATVAEFNKYVLPACLGLTQDLTERYGMVIGWGITENEEISPTLKNIQMPVVDVYTCLESDRALFGETLSKGILCAGYTNGTTVCNGDSGSGLFFQHDNAWYLGGIVSYTGTSSFGKQLCYPNGLGGFTNVRTYLSWISSITALQFNESDSGAAVETVAPPKAFSFCETPDKNNGRYVPLRMCDDLYDLFRKGLHQRNIKFLNWPLGGSDSTSICCPSPRKTSALIFHEKATKLGLSQCGPLSMDDKILYGMNAGLGQYPWMANVMYKHNRTRFETKCSGSLIHARYVLTAAHCGQSPSGPFAIVVRLGEYNFQETIDCEPNECLEPYKEYGIDKWIQHQLHKRENPQYDIALIRLETEVVFILGQIFPICLPLTAALLMLRPKQLTVTGWGSTNSGYTSDVLLKADLQIVDNKLDVCTRAATFCTRNQNAQCIGDPGSPLQTIAPINNHYRTVLFGIVSRGPYTCGDRSIPEVSVLVGYHIHWILDNMEI